jgi:hypothetical protein
MGRGGGGSDQAPQAPTSAPVTGTVSQARIAASDAAMAGA